MHSIIWGINIYIKSELTKQKKKYELVTETDEKHASITCGCIRFIDSFNFRNESLDTLIRILKDDDVTLTREVFGDSWQFVKKTAYPYEAFKKFSDYDKQ